MILITLQNKETYGIVELRLKGSTCDHTVDLPLDQVSLVFSTIAVDL
jgi:hypothetical protein